MHRGLTSRQYSTCVEPTHYEQSYSRLFLLGELWGLEMDAVHTHHTSSLFAAGLGDQGREVGPSCVYTCIYMYMKHTSTCSMTCLSIYMLVKSWCFQLSTIWDPSHPWYCIEPPWYFLWESTGLLAVTESCLSTHLWWTPQCALETLN